MIFKCLKITLIFSAIAIAVVFAVFLINPKYIKGMAAPFANMGSFNVKDYYRDKIVVEVPASYELIQIAYCLTEKFQNEL